MLEGLKVALVLLLNFPILELAAMITVCTGSTLGLSHSLANSGADLAARLCSSVQVRRQRFALLSLDHLGDKGCNLELSSSTIL